MTNRRDRGFWALVSLVLLVPFLDCGCRDDDPDPLPEAQVMSRSGSYYPVQAVDANGAPRIAYWTYRINKGESFLLNTKDLVPELGSQVLEIKCSDLDMRFTDDPRVCLSTVQGTISGGAIGSFSASLKDVFAVFQIGKPASLIFQKYEVAASLNIGGNIIDVSFVAELRYVSTQLGVESPLEWFPDHPDLATPARPVDPDTLWDRTKDFSDPTRNLPVTVSIQQTLAVTGLPIRQWQRKVDLQSDQERWLIFDKIATGVVQGKEYNDVVSLGRTALFVGLAENTAVEAVRVKYWVAKGIGCVQSELPLLPFVKIPVVTSELIDTNLVAP